MPLPSLRLFPAVLVALALAAPSARAEGAAEVSPRLLTVTGEGSVSAAPDMAVVSIGVSQEAPAAADAVAAMNQGMTAVMAELASAGIADKDIQTGSLRLDPQYDPSPDGTAPRVTGYVASSTLNVRVLDLATVGEVIGAAVSSGANRLQGLTFDLQDKAPLMAEARRAAVADARAKAALYAEAAGVTLGPVQSIAEQGGGLQPSPAPMFRMDAAMAVPVAAGELDLQAAVTMVFAIGG